MVSLCLPSDALLQHLPSYLGFSYLGRGVSLHGCSSKVQPLLLTLDVLEKTLESPLDCKEMKEISPGCSLEGMMLKLKVQYFGHLMRRVDSLEETDTGRDWGQEE